MEKYHVTINGIEVDASYSERAVKEIFWPLLRHLTELQKEKQRRILVFLAAPPGAGKSTLCSFLEKLSRENEDVTNLQAIGMDGFHHYQDYLLTHQVMRDGKMIPMVKIKGAPITFDLEKLTKAVEKVRKGETCDWPSYDRHLHNPVEGTYPIVEDIVLLEGNYLLLEEEGWCRLREFADFSIRIVAGEEMLRERLIDRKRKSGNSLEVAEKFVDFSDMENVRLCRKKTTEADLQLYLDENGEYSRYQ